MSKHRKGAIVGAILTTHVPRLFLQGADREAYIGKNPSSFFEALPQMYNERIQDLDFDTFLLIDTHWWTTTDFFINANRALSGKYTSDEMPDFIHDYEYRYEGDPELAFHIGALAVNEGLPVKISQHEGLPVHYPTLVPMHYLNPHKTQKVLPMSIAYTSSVAYELAYGSAVSEAVKTSNRRVVIVASGGLSHKFWSLDSIKNRASPDLYNIPESNRKWDEQIIRYLKAGLHSKVIRDAHEFRYQCAPEGRFAHYLRMVGALGGAECTLKGIQYGNYEAAIGTGQVIFWFDTQ